VQNLAWIGVRAGRDRIARCDVSAGCGTDREFALRQRRSYVEAASAVFTSSVVVAAAAGAAAVAVFARDVLDDRRSDRGQSRDLKDQEGEKDAEREPHFEKSYHHSPNRSIVSIAAVVSAPCGGAPSYAAA